MKIPVLSTILLIFILWLHYEVKRNKSMSKEASVAFWNRENSANLARRIDISDLNYITIPLERLPMSDREDDTLNSYRDTIAKLSDRKILNLSGISNTDLKFKYGAANFNKLSDCDNNFNLMTNTLQKWGERFYSKGLLQEAVSVLEFAAECRTEISKTYLLLSKIYKEQNTPEKISSLLNILSDPNLNMFQKETVVEELKNSQSEI